MAERHLHSCRAPQRDIIQAIVTVLWVGPLKDWKLLKQKGFPSSSGRWNNLGTWTACIWPALLQEVTAGSSWLAETVGFNELFCICLHICVWELQLTLSLQPESLTMNVKNWITEGSPRPTFRSFLLSFPTLPTDDLESLGRGERTDTVTLHVTTWAPGNQMLCWVKPYLQLPGQPVWLLWTPYPRFKQDSNHWYHIPSAKALIQHIFFLHKQQTIFLLL